MMEPTIMESTLAVILGGGAGSRLYPLTKSRSKPAVPVGGKYRLVDIPISNCLHSNIRKIYVLTQFNSASLNQHIKNTFTFDVFSRGFVDILAAEQTPTSHQWFQGTADAVRQTFRYLQNHGAKYVMILSGDQLYQMDFHSMMQNHIDKDAKLTIATIPVTAEDAEGFGIMKTDDEDFITSFVEKPSGAELQNWKSPVPEEFKQVGKEYLASMGIYIFDMCHLKKLIDENPMAVDFGKEIIPMVINSGEKVISYKYTGYWTDIGTIKSFYEANLELTDPLPRFDLYAPGKRVFTRPRLLPPSKIFGTHVNRSIIAEGSVIEASVIEHSIIGVRSRVGKNTVIKDSIVMGKDYFPTVQELDNTSPDQPLQGIGANCHIEKAIIDKNARIGDNVRIIGGDHLEDTQNDNFSVIDGIVVVEKNGMLKSGTVI
ncbi:glucose-1-phosphate adenylyltransferase [Balneolaceae bacterium ANBcel3]|nr:glucose-1-phosphate adenylyltransferase [Balneolaceae bacterium ANBcel3]